MKKILLALISLIVIGVSANAQAIAYKLKYHPTNNNFEVAFVPTGFAVPSINMGISQVTLVFEKPTSVVNTSNINVTSLNGITWNDQDFSGNASAMYVGFQTPGGPLPITNGTPVVLFTFVLPAGNCNGNLRLFVNGSDAPDPTGAGGDFTSYMSISGIGDFNSTNPVTPFLSCPALGPLPIKFLGFAAKKEGSNAILNWEVSGENQNTSHYDIERSEDGSRFTNIATVNARRTSSEQNYVLTDNNLLDIKRKVAYYRVKQIDLDNKVVYSAVRLINLERKSLVEVYPNPVKDRFIVSVLLENTSDKKVKLVLTNQLGQVVDNREVAKKDAEYYDFHVKASIVSGEYTLAVYDDLQLIATKKIIVHK